MINRIKMFYINLILNSLQKLMQQPLLSVTNAAVAVQLSFHFKARGIKNSSLRTLPINLTISKILIISVCGRCQKMVVWCHLQPTT